MTATNHALTGTAIGLVVGTPWAIPLAVASHFICDAIPHFGFTDDEAKKQKILKGRLFRNYLVIEAVICSLLVISLALLRPDHWLLAAVCAFAAAAPDLLSANRYFSTVKNKRWQPNLYSRFAHNIQWFEKPVGAVVEIVWLVAALMIISPFVR